ncbi:MAG: hypothetical protein GXP15_11010, partial [Gammaproteobacteria bacterium]|nr:hypothetical protein [Gammaproteobacteria bacterium]
MLTREPKTTLAANSLFFAIAATCLLIFFASTETVAQTVRPTAQQLQMLNQLPPAQRQQALQALEELNRGSGGTSKPQSSVVEGLSPFPQANAPLPTDFTGSIEEPKAEEGSRLIIDLTVTGDLSRQEEQALQNDVALQRIQGSHYYELDDSGVLILPGLTNIPLLGLNAEAIEQRLGAEPSLRLFDVSVSILDAKSIGSDALEPFGYGVFESTLTGF